MATTATATAKAPAEAPAAAPKKKGKLLLIVALVVVLLAGGGAAAWFFLQAGADDEESVVPSKPSVFLPLDQFTVNLQSDDGQQQFLQAAMTLKVVDQDISDAIKAQLPEVRSRVLMLLSSKKAAQLTTVEGKNQLAAEIMREVEIPLPPAKGNAKAKAKHKADDEEDATAKKSKKAKAKSKTKEEVAEEEKPAAAPQRVLAVFFTHFIVQ